jgi:hypothetical protein
VRYFHVSCKCTELAIEQKHICYHCEGLLAFSYMSNKQKTSAYTFKIETLKKYAAVSLETWCLSTKLLGVTPYRQSRHSLQSEPYLGHNEVIKCIMMRKNKVLLHIHQLISRHCLQFTELLAKQFKAPLKKLVHGIAC